MKLSRLLANYQNQLLTESFDSVNFCAKLSSTTKVDVVDVVGIYICGQEFCVCVRRMWSALFPLEWKIGFESRYGTNQIKQLL
jgi:hypothetical protein